MPRRLHRLVPYLLCLPLLLFLGLLFVLPVGRMMLLSVTPDTAGHGVTLERFTKIIQDPYYQTLTLRTLRVSLATTLLSLVLAFPVAVLMRGLASRWRSVLVLIMISPLLTSVVVRSLAWVFLLSRTGIINQALGLLGVPELRLLYTEPTMVVGLTHVFFGYMVIALLTALRRIDDSLYAAAENLGAGRLRMFFEITLPLSLPGIMAGGLLVFTLSASTYVTPTLLGGSRNSVLAVETYNLAISSLDWNDAAAVATVLFLLIAAIVWLATATLEGGRRKVIFR